jgi:hypothetical protein
VPDWVKFGMGVLTGVLLYSYWLLAGRARKGAAKARYGGREEVLSTEAR